MLWFKLLRESMTLFIKFICFSIIMCMSMRIVPLFQEEVNSTFCSLLMRQVCIFCFVLQTGKYTERAKKVAIWLIEFFMYLMYTRYFSYTLNHISWAKQKSEVPNYFFPFSEHKIPLKWKKYTLNNLKCSACCALSDGVWGLSLEQRWTLPWSVESHFHWFFIYSNFSIEYHQEQPKTYKTTLHTTKNNFVPFNCLPFFVAELCGLKVEVQTRIVLMMASLHNNQQYFRL